MDRLNRVCDMYAAGERLKVICMDLGVGMSVVLRDLSKARALGDVRVRKRRPDNGASRCEGMRQMFEASGDGFVSKGEMVSFYWGDGPRPASYLTLIRIAVSDCRERFGMEIRAETSRQGYRWVRA